MLWYIFYITSLTIPEKKITKPKAVADAWILSCNSYMGKQHIILYIYSKQEMNEEKKKKEKKIFTKNITNAYTTDNAHNTA